MEACSFLTLVLLHSVFVVQSVKIDHFYPFGERSGDSKVPGGESTISPRVDLNTPVRFYNDYYSGLYVSTMFSCYIDSICYIQ